MKQFVSIISWQPVLLVLFLSGLCLAAPAIDSGDWLTQELDMQSQDKFNEALALKNLKDPKDFESKQVEETVDQVEAAAAAGDYKKLTSLGRFEEALEVIDSLIAEKTSQEEITKLAEERIQVQKELDRSVEELMQKYDLKLSPPAKH